MAKPTEKDKRYDRQLRLWGDHGQTALESAHVCLVNATAVGTELLKNLVLPGIGAFTILDPSNITARDLGSNFFLTADRIGGSRAVCSAELLCELNSSVNSNVCVESLVTVMESSPNYFDQFTVVVATGLTEAELRKLARLLWERGIPLVVARSYGLIGYIRLAVQSQEIVESHPDNYHEDLRLDCPFDALESYMASIDIDSLDNTKHANLPYLVVLFKFLDTWKVQHGHTSFPVNYREKKEFKELVRSGIRSNEEDVPLEEENFDEAINNINSLLIPTRIPAEVQALMDESSCLSLSTESKDFWLLVQALREFVASEGNGRLPLRGSIPDMISSSDLYIELQRLYQTKAREDIESLTSHLSQILVSVGKSPHSIPDSQIRLFCRNSAFLRVVRCRSLEEEYLTPNVEELSHQLNDIDSDLAYYALLRAADMFHSQYKSYPGSTSDLPMDADVTQLKSFVSSLVQQEWGGLSDCAPALTDEKITEFCRYGGGELHSIAAYIGGVASQEVIKLITHQYVPINNTYIYNGANSTSVTALL